MAQDHDVLSIVQTVSDDLRRDHVFCDLLAPCDEDTTRRIAQSYKAWLNRVLQNEHERALERED